ncbi:Peptidase family M48 [Xenococcus sp. PCC 7305]|uniref:M48 family metallopeptidase n=1 Tax=Xenococcus sp. PCC 7305 TaxID=102125 RepID=UPI0002ABF0B9|nr:M48 family metallopeptidase [Xenococcus sp. PCC 7305]ELS03501.1 Peptidase family M48 [Xenococcus sp. PCC 7305]
MVYHPKEIPEDINVTPVHPLVNFAYLLGTVVIVSGLVYVVLGAIATQLAIRISPETEMKIGQQLISSMSDIDSTSYLEQQEYLEDLADSLQTQNASNALPATIHIQKEEQANAAVIPGGHIIVTTALLEEAESENELAFVLAHELGHHVARDSLKRLGRSLVFLTVFSVLGLGVDNADLVIFTGSLTDLHYSRQQETAADIYALSTVVGFYGHGGGSLDFFERIQAKDQHLGGKLSSYFSTHPLTAERIELLHEVAAEKGWQMTGELTDYQK